MPSEAKLGSLVSPEAVPSDAGPSEIIDILGPSGNVEEGPSATTGRGEEEEEMGEVERRLSGVSLAEGGLPPRSDAAPILSEGVGEGVGVSPSLLGCDWADIAGAVAACEEAGERIHPPLFLSASRPLSLCRPSSLE